MSTDEWKIVKLSEIAYLNYGKSLTSDIRKEGKIPVYSSSGITGWHDTALVNEDGIVIGRKGNVGSLFYAGGPFYCIDTAYYIKKSELKCNIKYFYYLLKTLGLDKLNEDSAVPGLNRDTAHSQQFSYPKEIDTQRRIAGILSALDDKIELNRQTNVTLEAIAQAIFKEWFVRFNFPGATGEMVESELGLIPMGWRVGKLGEMITNFDSKRVPLSRPERINRKGIFPYYGATSILDYIDDYLFDGVYLLMGEDGTVITNDEKPILQYISGKFWANNHAHVLQGKGMFSTEFIYLVLKNTNIKHIVTGAVQPKINQENMNNLNVIIPDSILLRNFQNIIKSFFIHKINIEEQNSTISTIRDTLLPKLLSGEIEV